MNTSANISSSLLREISDIIGNEHLSRKVLNAIRAIRREERNVATDNIEFERLFGAWKDNRSADEIIEDIYNSRQAGYERRIESFDE